MRTLLFALIAFFSLPLGAVEKPPLNDLFDYSFVNEQKMPLVISAKGPDPSLSSFQHWAEMHQKELRALAAESGALLFRDFS